ncbi:hypothetical protein MACK_003529 [Theileria orientalis]|uniref:Uncharacterized protein n=1 Tax=Theileria orientalis TaxID=68886 RepID=A0A976SJG5_THEOR|nr:hypothetical protein MACK_003529 [Theileria orientalis]
MDDDDERVPFPHEKNPFEDEKTPNLNKKNIEQIKFDFESNRDFNKDLDLLPPLRPKKDPDFPVCKPDGMLIGQNNPFFTEESHQKKSSLPNLRYDVIGPYGNEVNPDIDTYPLHTSKSKKDDLPDFGFNKPNFNPRGPGGPGGFGGFF